jgi:hypothetical protein
MITESLKSYLKEIHQSLNITDKWQVCQKYSELKWQISLPMVAGIYTENYWIGEFIDDGIRFKLAIPLEIHGNPTNIITIPPSQEFLDEFECELIAIE